MRGAAAILQRAIERGDVGRLCAIDGPIWSLSDSFEALAPDDDTLGPFELQRGDVALPRGIA